jgi:copper transport protein
MHPTTATRRIRSAAALAIVVLSIVLGAAPADAHAELLVSTPNDGDVLEVAPGEVVLQFTETVQLQADGVRIVDADGDRVDAGAAVAEGATVTAPVEDELERGSYVVAWRVVSADGHPIRGAFTFSVGEATALDDGLADAAFGAGGDRNLEIAAAALRGLAYLGTLGAAGVVLVAARLRRPEEPTPVQRWVTIGVFVALASITAQAVVLGALFTGRGLGAITEPGVLALVLDDGFGLAAIVALVALLAVLITAGLPFEGPVRAVALSGAVLAPVSFALTGHTRTMDPASVGYAAAIAHLLAGAVWFGGLGAAISIVRRRRADGDDLGAAEAIATFSGIAAVSVAVVALAGTALGWIEVGGLEPLTSTTYGRLLLAKVALVAVVVALGAWNRFRLVPTIARDALDADAADAAEPEVAEAIDGAASRGSAGWATLVRLLRVEGALLVVVLALTGVLVNVTPAKASIEPGAVTVTAPLGEGSIDVTVDPARPGRNDVHVYFFDASGRPDDRYDTATIRLELPEQGLGPLDREPVRAGVGHLQLVGTDFALSGTWTITVTVKPDRFTETSATVEVPLR